MAPCVSLMSTLRLENRTDSRSRPVHRFHGNGFHVVCRPEFDSAEMRRAFIAPDALIDRGTPLKRGNATTISQVVVAGQILVVKRYNPIRIRKFLRQLFRFSRARAGWKNALLFERYRIPTAKAIALIERPYDLRRPTSYLVTEFVPGTNGNALFTDPDQSATTANDLARKTAAALRRLHDAHLSHGDLKATNIIYGESAPVFIDLDAARRHRIGLFERWRQRRDLQRLLQNVATEGPLAAAFGEIFPEMGRRA